jgi:O-glycosyl hydrolase
MIFISARSKFIEGTHGQSGGSDDPRILVQARQQDLQGFGGRLQSLLPHSPSNPSDQLRQPFDHSSAQNQAARVKSVHEARASGNESGNRFINNPGS